MDSLIFANNIEDCQFKCDKEHTFNCRSYSIIDKRCFLSGDDSVSLSKSALLPIKFGSVYGEKKCVTEHCTNGIFTYEKITGYVMRQAVTNSIKIKNTGSLGITEECRTACDESGLTCPAFMINYQSSRCEKLDRSTQGHTLDLNPQEGESIFEKLCLRVPDVVNSMCRDKFWAFERVIGHELTPTMYGKTYNFVQTRRDCQEYCLHEKDFTCRSALYNEESTECKLSSQDRRTKPFAYVRNNNYKISYLENQCIREHSRCPFVETANGYPTYTDIVVRDDINSAESCEKLCSQNKEFLCRSYAYYSSNNQCFLSGDDRTSAGTTALQIRPGMSFFERKCDLTSVLTTTVGSLSVTNSYNDHGFNSSIINTDHMDSHVMSSHGLSSGRDEDTPHTQFDDITTTSSSLPSSPPTAHLHPGSSFPSGVHGGESLHPGFAPKPLDGHIITVSAAKCGPNSRFTFERVPNFEPVGGYLNLLFTDSNNPGIVTECTQRCQHHEHCRAFIVDYNQRACHGIFDNTTIGRFDLRLSVGKDYFEGFCVPNHLVCEKLWLFDRIVDQASVGVNARQVIRFISKIDCKIRCLEERRFPCTSASYDGHLNECRLFDTDRHSGSISLSFTKGIDYLENQCSFDGKSCSFLPYERDVSMISVTKSLRSSSSFFCEQECSQEKDFNCRSFTYIDQSSIPGANICFLSTDSRKSSQKGSTHNRPRALYGERDCNRRSRDARIVYHGMHGERSMSSHSMSHPYSSMHHHGIPPALHPYSGMTSTVYPMSAFGSSMSPYSTSHLGGSSVFSVPASGQSSGGHLQSGQFLGHGYLPSSSAMPSVPVMNDFDYKTHPEDINSACNYHQYTFEKTFGYDMRYARKDRSRLPPRLGVAVQCQDECLRRRFKCNAFIIEYGPVQSCFFLEESAAENRRVLQKVPEVAYFEKICLKERNCGKLWTFERVIGFDLDETPEREIPGVPVRTDCQDYCLAEKSFSCRSVTYNYKTKACRLFTETRRSRPTSFKPSLEDIDYFENHCSKEPPTCQYKDHNDMYFPFVDRLTNAFSLSDCQRQCDGERLFQCRAVSFETFARDCALYSEDTASLKPILSSHYSLLSSTSTESRNASSFETTVTPVPESLTLFGSNAVLQQRKHSLYSEKGSCEQVSVQCTQQDMLLTMNFDSPFSGRVYAKGNPSQCYVLGTGSTQLQFAISLGSKCGTRPEVRGQLPRLLTTDSYCIFISRGDLEEEALSVSTKEKPLMNAL